MLRRPSHRQALAWPPIARQAVEMACVSGMAGPQDPYRPAEPAVAANLGQGHPCISASLASQISESRVLLPPLPSATNTVEQRTSHRTRSFTWGSKIPASRPFLTCCSMACAATPVRSQHPECSASASRKSQVRTIKFIASSTPNVKWLQEIPKTHRHTQPLEKVEEHVVTQSLGGKYTHTLNRRDRKY